VIDGANAARAANADLLVAVGGGSVIDAVKVMQLCLRNSVRDAGTLSDFVVRVVATHQRDLPTRIDGSG